MFEHFGYIMAEGLPKQKRREVFESLRHSDPEGYELYAPDLDDMVLVKEEKKKWEK